MEPTAEVQITEGERGNVEGKPEHKTKTYERQYHGQNIKIIELDHWDSEQGGIEYKLPENWREQLRAEIEPTHGPIVPEYCMPDLERYAYKELGTGLLIKNADTEGIVTFFSYVSRLAGASGRSQLSMDPANTNWYFLFEAFSNTTYGLKQMAKNIQGEDTEFTAYVGEYGTINPAEYSLHTANDARHLITARGILEECLRNKSEPETMLHINTPKHAERVDDYIKRQIEWENQSSIKVGQPEDLKYVAPTEEQKKMTIYGRPPLHREVREYEPTLPPSAYEIDLFFNDEEGKVGPSDSQEVFIDKLTQLNNKIEEYLLSSQAPPTKNEKIYNKRLRAAQNILKISVKKPDLGIKIYKNIKPLIRTNNIGWKFKRKSYIY